MGTVSREAESGAIDRFLTRMATSPAALVLEGEAGIGKTTLWLDGIVRAVEAGTVVLSARGAGIEARSSFAAAADLLRDVDTAVLSALPPVQQSALDRILLRGTSSPATQERAVATAFRSVVQALARESPVLIAVDDAQWLDVASRAMLGFTTSRLEGPIGLLVTTRTGEPDGVDTGSWLRLPDPAAITRIAVGPLSLGATHALFALRLGRALPRLTMVRIHETSGGNPFYALELARTLDEHAGPAAPLPTSLSELVARRVGDVEPAVAELLVAVAAATAPSVELLTRTLEVPRAEVEALVEQAETAGIIEYRGGSVQFTHPLLAHGVYKQAGPSLRRRIHRELAAVVGEPESRARHLALAATTADAATISALDAAADQAARRGAPGAAAELLELAIGLGDDTVLRRLRAAELHFRAGSLPAAGRILPSDIDAVPPGPLRCLALMLSGAMHAYDDDLVAAVEAMSRALDEAGSDPALGALCSMRLALGLHMIGRFPDAVGHARAAVDLAAIVGVPGLRSQALSLLVTASFVAGHGVDADALATAVELEDPDGDATTWFRACAVEAMIAAWTGELTRARTLLVGVAQRMQARGTELDIIWAANHLSMVDVWLGRYPEAEASAREAVQRANLVGSRQLLITAWNVDAEVAARTGREDDARSAAGAAIAAVRETGAQHLAIAPTATLGFLELSLGDYQSALNVLEPLLARFDAGYGTEIVFGGHLPDAIESLVALGRSDEAEPLVAALEDNGNRLNRAWMSAVGARGRAQICAARGDLDGADAALQCALTQHDRLEMPFERARTELLLGQIQRRRRNRALAATTLATALDTFERLGSPLWAERTRSELVRTQAIRGDRWSLTDTERRTAELAAAGLSNREIAAEMFQSVKTVEMNLTRLYRKLDIRSRSQLSGRLSAMKFDDS